MTSELNIEKGMVLKEFQQGDFLGAGIILKEYLETTTRKLMKLRAINRERTAFALRTTRTPRVRMR
jgi:hypothetical protein